LNTYLYVAANPLKAIDRRGEQGWEEILFIAALEADSDLFEFALAQRVALSESAFVDAIYSDALIAAETILENPWVSLTVGLLNGYLGLELDNLGIPLFDEIFATDLSLLTADYGSIIGEILDQVFENGIPSPGTTGTGSGAPPRAPTSLLPSGLQICP
jgi:hypothetical protein